MIYELLGLKKWNFGNEIIRLTFLHSMIVLTLMSCESQQEKSQNIVIREAGTYWSFDKRIKIDVNVDNKLVSYTLTDNKGLPLTEDVSSFSDLHNWIMVLDTSDNLWVLSSDLGYIVWRRNFSSGIYESIALSFNIQKKDVPESVYKDIDEFINRKGSAPEY